MCIDLVRPLEGRNPVCAEEPAHGHNLNAVSRLSPPPPPIPPPPPPPPCFLLHPHLSGYWRVMQELFFSGGGDKRKAESGEVAVSHPPPECWPGPAVKKKKKKKKKHGLDCMLLFMWLNFPCCFFFFFFFLFLHGVHPLLPWQQGWVSTLGGGGGWRSTSADVTQEVFSLHESTKQKHPTNPWDSAFCVVRIDAYCQHIFWYIWGI